MILLIRSTLIFWLATNVSSFSVGGPLGRPAYRHHSLDSLAVSLSESNEVENIELESNVPEAEELSIDSAVGDIEESEQKEPEATDEVGDIEESEEKEPEATDDTESTNESGSDEVKEKSTDTERHTVYVGNLPYTVGVNDVRNLFTEHVNVGYVNLPKDKETGNFKGFAFVDVDNADEIVKAIEAVNGMELEGRALRVNRYLAKDQIRSVKNPVDGSKKLYVGNLPYKATKEDVNEFFAEFGEVLDVFLPVNNYGDPRGFGFISVKEDDLDTVLENTNGAEFMGRNLVVNLPLPPGEKPARRARQQNVKLFVGNLSFFTQSETLEEVFEEFGRVLDCYIPKDINNGNSRGFGFVTMERDAALAAIDALDGCELDGRMISVNEARPKGGPRNDSFDDESESDEF